jgi:hypothetical protein
MSLVRTDSESWQADALPGTAGMEYACDQASLSAPSWGDAFR